MNPAPHIARHLRGVYIGGNWTDVNLKDTLAGLDWRMATAQTGYSHSIAALVFHINYFIGAVLKVLQGGPLDAHDRFSFDLPPISSQQDWEALMQKTFTEAESLALLVEQLPESKLWEDFTDKKYGSYYSNLQGLIEHTHYHLGQIVIIKKQLMKTHVK